MISKEIEGGFSHLFISYSRLYIDSQPIYWYPMFSSLAHLVSLARQPTLAYLLLIQLIHKLVLVGSSLLSMLPLMLLCYIFGYQGLKLLLCLSVSFPYFGGQKYISYLNLTFINTWTKHKYMHTKTTSMKSWDKNRSIRKGEEAYITYLHITCTNPAHRTPCSHLQNLPTLTLTLPTLTYSQFTLHTYIQKRGDINKDPPLLFLNTSQTHYTILTIYHYQNNIAQREKYPLSSNSNFKLSSKAKRPIAIHHLLRGHQYISSIYFFINYRGSITRITASYNNAFLTGERLYRITQMKPTHRIYQHHDQKSQGIKHLFLYQTTSIYLLLQFTTSLPRDYTNLLELNSRRASK